MDKRFAYLNIFEGICAVVVNGDGVILFATDNFLRLFDYGSEELVGCPVERLIPSDMEARHEEHRRQFMAAPSAKAMAKRLVTAKKRDGTRIHVKIALAPTAEDCVIATVEEASGARTYDELSLLSTRAAEVGRLQLPFVMEQIGELRREIASARLVAESHVITDENMRRVFHGVVYDIMAELGIDVSTPMRRAEFITEFQNMRATLAAAKKVAMYLGLGIIGMVLAILSFLAAKGRALIAS